MVQKQRFELRFNVFVIIYSSKLGRVKLGFEPLIRCERVNRQCKELSQRDVLWLRYFELDYRDSLKPMNASRESLREIYN